MVGFYLLTFPRFPLRKKEHKSYFGKNRSHGFRTSRCAGYLLDHSGEDATVWKCLAGANPQRTAEQARLKQLNAYRAEDPFGGGENNVSVGFGSAEDQFHPDDAINESDFGVI